jgi:hypothetical protein
LYQRFQADGLLCVNFPPLGSRLRSQFLVRNTVNQLEGNNIDVNNGKFQADGQPWSPGYNMKLGFVDGAQNDIFQGNVARSPAETPDTITTNNPSHVGNYDSPQAIADHGGKKLHRRASKQDLEAAYRKRLGETKHNGGD